MPKHSLDRKTAVKASGQARSTAYRTMRGAEWGSPARLFSNPENVAPAPGPRRSEYEGSEEWFLVADSLLYLHSESRDERASFAEDCHVSEEYEQKLLQGLREICKKRIGQRFQLGKDKKRRFPGRPKQEGKRLAINRMAKALDHLASKKPEHVQKAVESYASLIQADGRLILTKERNEGDLQQVIWLVQNLGLPLLNLRFLGFSTEEAPQAGCPLVFNVNNRSSRHQATLRQMKRQFRRLKVSMPEPLQCVRPKNTESEDVLEHVAIEVQWNQHACVAFRYVMAVAAISRFWETYMQQPTTDSDNGRLAGIEQELGQNGRELETSQTIPGGSVPAQSQRDSLPIVMFFRRVARSPSWVVCFYECGSELKLLQEWQCDKDQTLIAAATRGGVSKTSMLPFMKAGSGVVQLMLTRQQYQNLTAGQRKGGEQTR